MRAYSISPLDTWFFRDGRPYYMNESSQVDVRSLFPPSAYTVIGAMRASLARELGWNGESRKRWSAEIMSVLGDGRKNLGKLRFLGPYIYSEKHGGLLLPTPLNLIGEYVQDKFCKTCEPSKPLPKMWSFACLSPRNPVDCDLGDGVRLPSTGDDIKGLKTLSDYYLTVSDFEALLAGGDLKDINPIKRTALWNHEYWVGLKRNSITLTTEDRALFSKHHVRLAPGVSLLMLLEGPEELPELGSLLAFGGENRVASSRIMSELPKFLAEKGPKLRVDGDKIRFTVVHLTPACLGSSWPGPGGRISGVPGKVVSACIERPLFIGGWDSVRGEPLPLQPYVPAGSTWFFEADSSEAEAIEHLHLTNIGDDANCGFGQVAVGLW